MRQIYLRNIDDYALVDDGTYEWAKDYSWYAYRGQKDRYCYVRTTVYLGRGRYLSLQLHRLVADAPPGTAVTFRNRNRLDCRRENVVLASRSVIRAHGDGYPVKAGAYRGVITNRGRHKAFIGFNGKVLYLGTYATPERAALAYDSKARELYGDLATLNFPERYERDPERVRRQRKGK